MSFKVPTAVIDLPSKGLIYPKNNILSEGKLELKYPGAEQEDILTNDFYINQGITMEKLIQSIIVTKIDYNDLIVGDKDFIFISTRVLMFGAKYDLNYILPGEGEVKPIVADLTTIKNKDFDESLFVNGKNDFDFTLPFSKNDVTFKLLTHKDEKAIEQEVEAMKKISKIQDKSSSVSWYYTITSINGNRETGVIRDFVNNGLITLDSTPLRQYIAKISPGVDLTFDYTSPEGKVYNGLNLPITRNFFRPSLSV